MYAKQLGEFVFQAEDQDGQKRVICMLPLACIWVLQCIHFNRDCLETSAKDEVNDEIKESENPLYASRWEINPTFHSLYFIKKFLRHVIFHILSSSVETMKESDNPLYER